jgi:hypothetical protein
VRPHRFRSAALEVLFDIAQMTERGFDVQVLVSKLVVE